MHRSLLWLILCAAWHCLSRVRYTNAEHVGQENGITHLASERPIFDENELLRKYEEYLEDGVGEGGIQTLMTGSKLANKRAGLPLAPELQWNVKERVKPGRNKLRVQTADEDSFWHNTESKRFNSPSMWMGEGKRFNSPSVWMGEGKRFNSPSMWMGEGKRFNSPSMWMGESKRFNSPSMWMGTRKRFNSPSMWMGEGKRFISPSMWVNSSEKRNDHQGSKDVQATSNEEE